MSDDTVIKGVFGKQEEDIPTAAEVFEILADELEGEADVETVVILFHPDRPAALMGNVEIDRAALLLMLGQVAIQDTVMGGADDHTLH